MTRRRLVWDQEGCIGCRRGGETPPTAEFSVFVGTLATGAVILNRADPEAKGIVEPNNDYYETNASCRMVRLRWRQDLGVTSRSSLWHWVVPWILVQSRSNP